METAIVVLAAGGSVVDLDATYLVQLGIFLALFLFLRFALFKPLLRLLEQREEGVVEARRSADDFAAEAAAKSATYGDAVNRERFKAAEEKAARVAEGRAEEEKILREVQVDTARRIAEMRQRIGDQTARARVDLARDAEVLAGRMAEKILGRAVKGAGG